MIRALTVIGVILMIGAGVAALTTIHTPSDVGCGVWLSRDYTPARAADASAVFESSLTGDSYEDGKVYRECQESISSRTPVVAALGVLGIAALLGAAILRLRPPPPSKIAA